MKFANPNKVLAITLAALSIATAHAEDDATQSMFRMSGFGTAGFSHSDNNLSDFSSTVFHPNGAGYTHNWSPDVDTKLGLQVNGDFTERFSGVVQVISQQAYNNSYSPSIEWANLSYKLTPDLTVRYGRTVWPLLLRSETQNVGYGNPFVRNTTELLANMPNTYSDGIDVTYRFPIGAASNSLQFLSGHSYVKYPCPCASPPDGYNGAYSTLPASSPFNINVSGQNFLNVNHIGGVSDVLEYGDLKVHTAFMKLDYDWLANGFYLAAVPYSTWSLGFNYDPGDWFITADLLKVHDDSYGYFTALTYGAGYRIGDWTPYVLASSLTQDSMGSLNTSGVTWTAPGDKQTMTAIGFRWDFMKNTDFKLQYEQVRSGTISTIFASSLTNWQTPAFYSNPNADVVSAVVDFVF